MQNVTTTSQRLIAIEITQQHALNLAASIASDLNHAVDSMQEEFHKRHQKRFDLLLALLSSTK